MKAEDLYRDQEIVQDHDFYHRVEDALYETDPIEKCQKIATLHQGLQDGIFMPYSDEDITISKEAGRPEKPLLVSPQEVPRRGLGSDEGVLALVHAICHIEFNAMNLGLDAAYRFRNMPLQFYKDWISVANDEAKHFQMLANYLVQNGSFYGAFVAHSGLWDSAERTAHDPLVRMALVPRVLEARGLDVTPGIMNRLKEVGRPEIVDLLKVILEEEEGHVLVGNRWYRELCAARNLPPKETFFQLLEAYGQTLKPPFNIEARLRSGFTQEEIDFLVDSINL